MSHLWNDNDRLLMLLHALVSLFTLFASTRAAGASLIAFRKSALTRNERRFVYASLALSAASALTGFIVYPPYKLDVRMVVFEPNHRWLVSLFEIKEHFGVLMLGASAGSALLVRGQADEELQPLRRWLLAGLCLWTASMAWFAVLSGLAITSYRSVGDMLTP
ncbi:MAG: hypothetical protein GMKNLPBB_01712 [Myxococcota bacterium]|nr:hypothetical protein [Myxococcota bacterium]